jgi:transcriptional regulator with XRE-family HTH domain
MSIFNIISLLSTVCQLEKVDFQHFLLTFLGFSANNEGMEVDQELAARFASIREKEGIKQAEFAEKIGISRPQVAGLENGHARISERNIKAVCKAYNINENWLRTGEGAMYDTPSSPLEPLNDDEKRLVSMFRRLTAASRRMVLEIVRQFWIADGSKSDFPSETREAPPAYGQAEAPPPDERQSAGKDRARKGA